MAEVFSPKTQTSAPPSHPHVPLQSRTQAIALHGSAGFGAAVGVDCPRGGVDTSVGNLDGGGVGSDVSRVVGCCIGASVGGRVSSCAGANDG